MGAYGFESTHPLTLLPATPGGIAATEFRCLRQVRLGNGPADGQLARTELLVRS
jgi:hypothetical protein